MEKREAHPDLPKTPLRVYIALVAILGMAFLVYLGQRVDWGAEALGDLGLFTLIIVVAGSFPIPVAPRIKTDMSAAALFGAALLLEPGIAALAGAIGVVTYTMLLRFRRDGMRVPWYKHPFNAGQTALFVGATSLAFDALTSAGQLLTPAVVWAAGTYYLVNASLVSVAASLQLGMSSLRFWWAGTKENGPAELSLFAFGFLGAVAYRENAWSVIALFLPVAIIYIAFSRLYRANAELEALQGSILSTSKLSSVGAISLDLAHQIKNPLAILLGNLEDLQEHLEEGSVGRMELDSAAEACWRIQELTHTFASMSQHQWVQLDIHELLDEAFGMAALRNRKVIEMRREYEEGPLDVKGNPVLLREALSNIFTNAMEAVDDGGLLTIGTYTRDGEVIARVSDNGVGIPAERMAHLLEPFNSTKPNGQGLGLFAAKPILEMHRGEMVIDSIEGEGTSVTLSLPATLSQDESLADSIDSQLSVRSR